MREHFDAGSLVIIIVTFVLFGLALFAKGLTHDLLMEGGVLLVSVKLIVMAYKNSVAAKDLSKELRDIKDILQKREEQRDQRDGS
jgi:hypothetical protein